jgi:hypothetical protein
MGYADECPAGPDAEMVFLRTCNNARRLRGAVLDELIRYGEASAEEQPVTKPQADNRLVTTTAPSPGQCSETIRNHAAFIWSVADLLRGDYKQSEYGKCDRWPGASRSRSCQAARSHPMGSRRLRLQ